MQDTKHTPGPWREKGFIIESGAHDGDMFIPVADLVENGEVQANARLIAAAPDLLAELQNIANADTSDWDDPNDFKAWAQSRARHTIAKATK